MVALSFPTTPSTNDVYTANGKSWRWDGVSWNSILQTSIITITKSLTLTTDWQDTGIKNNDLASGTYVVSLYANDMGAGGFNQNEYYSGILSWYAGDTDSSVELPTDEIVLHRAGSSSEAGMYLRTFRSAIADPDNLRLQIYSNSSTASASNYVFSFKRII